ADQGAVWTYRHASTPFWQLEAAALKVLDGADNGMLGSSVALADDGDTALVGAGADDAGRGAAWVLGRSGGVWTVRSSKLTGLGEPGAGRFGAGVALAARGDVALVGAPGDATGAGAGWMYARSGGRWSELGGKLVGTGASGPAGLGSSAALSADAEVALLGGADDDGGKGAAWPFAAAPVVTTISPGTGPTAGGTQVA